MHPIGRHIIHSRVGAFRDEKIHMDTPLSDQIVLIRHEQDGYLEHNVPHLVVQHSPTGYEWGYGGSGPADLALNISEYFVRELGLEHELVDLMGRDTFACYAGKCSFAAMAVYQDVKHAFIQDLPRRGNLVLRIPSDRVRSYIGSIVLDRQALMNDILNQRTDTRKGQLLA